MQVPSVELVPGYHASRLIKGGWQDICTDEATASGLIDFLRAGVTTFETADVYPGGEAGIGAFLDSAKRIRPVENLDGVRVHTRYTVPLSGWRAHSVERSFARSSRRLGMARLDLLQLQCWDLRAPGLVEAGMEMEELRRQRGVHLLGTCNLGVEPLSCLLEAGVPVTTNQVPHSLLDRRAEGRLADFCMQHGIKLLTYGSLAGGFLSDSWRDVPDPEASGMRYSEEYLQILRAGGSWRGLQRLLSALSAIASGRSRTVAQVALRWVLQRGPGRAVLFGASHPRRLAQILPVFDFCLSDAECSELEAAAPACPPGDIGELERAPNSGLQRAIHRHLKDEVSSVDT